MPFDHPNPAPIGDLGILLDTRELIERRDRWLQRLFEDGDRHCLVAALSLSCGSPSFYAPNKLERRLARMLARQLPPEAPWWTTIKLVSARRRLMSFNDDRRTCHENVIALIDRTIQQLMVRAPQFVSA
jgi:hypothetical protein